MFKYTFVFTSRSAAVISIVNACMEQALLLMQAKGAAFGFQSTFERDGECLATIVVLEDGTVIKEEFINAKGAQK